MCFRSRMRIWRSNPDTRRNGLIRSNNEAVAFPPIGAMEGYGPLRIFKQVSKALSCIANLVISKNADPDLHLLTFELTNGVYKAIFPFAIQQKRSRGPCSNSFSSSSSAFICNCAASKDAFAARSFDVAALSVESGSRAIEMFIGSN